MRPVLFLLVAACADFNMSAPAQTATPAQHCAALRSSGATGVQVLSAEYVPAGALQPPRMGTFEPPALLVPAHCAVRTLESTSTDSAVTSDIWLPPATAWNGKLLATGNGGYSSALSLPQMADGLSLGYAVAGSDTGHQGDSLSFGNWHPERIRDWAYRSTHVLAVQAKAMAAAYYGSPAHKSYFSGCSTGGQQALSDAQRYPADFDGIIAGDPGFNRILLNVDFVESWLVAHPSAGPALPAAKLPLITRAAIAACSRQDGTAEPYINDPATCSFDPGTLTCSSTNADDCLTPGEVAMVRTLYAGAVRDAAGQPIYPGWPVGSEAGWSGYFVSPSQPARAEFWSSWVLHTPNFDPRAVPATGLVVDARKALPFVEAVDPDLRPFTRRGGKLLVYHGWADAVVPPQDTIQYFGKVQKVLGSTSSQDVRLFMVPGMGHCSGGPGATNFNALETLDRWVTEGRVPTTMLASHRDAGTVTFDRPLCPWPAIARWNGTGDPKAASSFTCTTATPNP